MVTTEEVTEYAEDPTHILFNGRFGMSFERPEP